MDEKVLPEELAKLNPRMVWDLLDEVESEIWWILADDRWIGYDHYFGRLRHGGGEGDWVETPDSHECLCMNILETAKYVRAGGRVVVTLGSEDPRAVQTMQLTDNGRDLQGKLRKAATQ